MTIVWWLFEYISAGLKSINVCSGGRDSCWLKVFCCDSFNWRTCILCCGYFRPCFKFYFCTFQKDFHTLPYPQKQRKIKLKPRIKLNLNIYLKGFAKSYLLVLHSHVTRVRPICEFYCNWFWQTWKTRKSKKIERKRRERRKNKGCTQFGFYYGYNGDR